MLLPGKNIVTFMLFVSTHSFIEKACNQASKAVFLRINSLIFFWFYKKGITKILKKHKKWCDRRSDFQSKKDNRRLITNFFNNYSE